MQPLLVFGGLAGLFLGWNLPNHYPPWPAFHLEYAAALGLALLTLAAMLPAGGQSATAAPQRLALPHTAWLWLAATALPLLQYATGQLPFRGDALLGLLYGLGVVLALVTGQLWAARAGRDAALRALWLTLLASGIAAGGLALAQWLGLPPGGWWAMEMIEGRPYGNIAQANHFALLMVMAIVAAVALFESAVLQHRAVLALAVAFLGWGAVISGSRAALLAGAVIALTWLLTRGRAPTRLRRRDLAVAVVGGLLMIGMAEQLQQALMLAADAPRLNPDAGPRTQIWLHFLAAITQHPWRGYGFLQSVAALAEVAASVAPSRNVTYAHNVVLDLMTWFGVPLGLLMTLAIAAWMAGWLRRDDDTRLMAQRHAVFALWLALALQSMFEYPYAHAYFLLPAALLAGVVTPPRVALLAGRRASPGRAALALAVVGAGLLAVLGSDYFRTEADFRALRFELGNVGTPMPREAAPAPWMLDQLAALNASAHLRPRPGLSADELAAMKRLARRFHIPSTRLDYAKALALNGRCAAAEAELRIIRSSYPPAGFATVDRQWRQWLQEQSAAGLLVCKPGARASG